MQHFVYTAKKAFRDGFPHFTMMRTWNSPSEFSPERIRLNEREFYKIFYVFEGCGTLLINDKSYSLLPGFAGVIHPNDLTTFRLTDTLKVYNILFTRSFVADWLGGVHNTNHFFDILEPSPDRSLNHDLLHLLDGNRTILALIRKMEQEFLSQDANSEYLVRLQLLELLIQLARLSSRGYGKKRHSDMVRLIQEHLRMHFSAPFSMNQLTERFGLSAKYLHSLFKRRTGKTIVQSLFALRMEEAKKMLRETGLPVEQICRRCGFSDPSNFYKQFRRETGVAPGAFRESNSSSLPPARQRLPRK